MKLYIARHGESKGNALGLTQGQKDYDLSEKGREQAKKLAERLKKEKIDCAYSSDLTRAADTAKEILKYHPETKLILTQTLREQNKGEFQGKPHELIFKAAEDAKIPFHEFRPKSGENYTDITNRLQDWYKKIKQKHKEKNVLVISHGSALQCLYLLITKKPLKNHLDFIPTNTSLTIIDVKNDKVDVLNCAKHLE